MKTKGILITIFVFALTLFSSIGVLYAGEYPDRPIKLIAPYGAGGSTDSSARILAIYLEKYLGQKVAVVNIAGAAGSIGTLQAYNSKPDGYTLLWNHLVLHTSYHTGIAKVTWDSLSPISQCLKFFNVVTVHKDAPWNSINDLIKDAKSRPGKIKWGVNIGSGLHFIAVGFQIATDTEFQLVDVGGDRAQTTALLGKHIDIATPSDTVILQYVEKNELKALATLGLDELPTLPGVPTLKEKGIDFSFFYQLGLFGPPNLPKNIVKTLGGATQKIVNDPEAIKSFTKIGMYPDYLEHDAYMKQLLNVDAKVYSFARKGSLIPSRLK